MFRAVLTAVAAVALVVGGVAPADAAPQGHHGLPGTPTAVRVAGSDDGAVVTWRAPRSGPRVTGWQVAVSPSEDRPHNGVDRLPAGARSDRFTDLTAGTEYRFAVRAVGRRGVGPAVTVRWTTPAPTPTEQSLFALDASGAVVRFPTTTNGAATGTTVVPSGGEGFTADRRGDVFVPSADRRSITEYPATGGAARTVATGLRLTADLRSDRAGNLYWADSVSGAVMKLPAGGGAPVTVVPSSGQRWVVGSDGTVSAMTVPDQLGADLTVVTVRPDGTRTTRSVAQSPYSFVSGLLADGSGTLYVNFFSTGVSGATHWEALPAGSSTLVAAVQRMGFSYAATTERSFLLAQSEGWCAAPTEGSPGGCTQDKTIRHFFERSLDGTVVDRATTGAVASGRGVFIGAADADGAMYLDVTAGATPGLWKIPAAGGVAQQLSAAQYSRLLVA